MALSLTLDSAITPAPAFRRRPTVGTLQIRDGPDLVLAALRDVMTTQKAQSSRVAGAIGQAPICATVSSPNLRARTRRTLQRPAPPPSGPLTARLPPRGVFACPNEPAGSP